MKKSNKGKKGDDEVKYWNKTVKKVLLIQPKLHVPLGSIRRLQPPLSLLYLAAVLEERGFNVSILDSSCEGYDNVVIDNGYQYYGLNDEDLKVRIKKNNPDFAGITCSFSSHEPEVLRTCKLVKSVNNNIITCIGGLHPTYQFKEMLEKCKELDFVIMKEGEYRLPTLLDAINNVDYSNQEGLAFRKNGKIIANPPTSVIENLDELPLPARHLIDMDKYIEVCLFSNPFPKGDRIAQILTTRGCPYNCNFCATKPYWGKFRARSVDNIIEEMQYLKDKYDINEIQFRDDNLLVIRKRAFELFDKMKKFNFSWCVGIMVSNLDDEMLRRMRECGCYQLTISIESGSERVLKEIIHKPIDLKKIKGIVDFAHKYNIRIHAANIIGMPGETKEEMERTFEFNKEVGADSAAFFVATPYLGSELYEQCKERGWLKGNSWEMDLKTPGIHIKKTDPEYVMSNEELVELAERKTKEHNEWVKKNLTHVWPEKFKVFLKKHKDEADKLMGRVV